MLKTKLISEMMDKKVLIIDFDQKSLFTLSKFVQSQGFQVITATDGQEGLEKFQSENPDLVIMEAMLPKLHGFDLCLKINSDLLRKAPIIIVTGVYRETLYKREALRFYGASAYFEKPWSRQELRSTILNLLIKPEEEAESLPVEKQELPEEYVQKEEVKTKRKAKIEQEVEEMLQNTLADLKINLNGRKKKTVFEPEHERQLPELEEIQEKKDLPPPRVRRIPFEDYREKKKTSTHFPVISLIVFILLVSCATIILFNSKKSNLSPKETVASPPPAPQVAFAQKQVSTEPSPIEQKITPGSEIKKEAPEESGESDLKIIEPELPEAPLLKIQGEPAANPETSKKEDQEKIASKEEINPAKGVQAKEQVEEEDSSQVNIRPGDVISLSLVDTPPVLLKTVEPKYPSMAYTMGIEGTVIINALISEYGDVLKTVVIQGIKNSFGLEKAAQNAIQQWKFKPAQKQGINVRVWKVISIVFKKK